MGFSNWKRLLIAEGQPRTEKSVKSVNVWKSLAFLTLVRIPEMLKVWNKSEEKGYTERDNETQDWVIINSWGQGQVSQRGPIRSSETSGTKGKTPKQKKFLCVCVCVFYFHPLCCLNPAKKFTIWLLHTAESISLCTPIGRWKWIETQGSVSKSAGRGWKTMCCLK